MERTFNVLRTTLLRASDETPLILVLEHLIRELPGHRLLLVASIRLGVPAPWLEGPLTDRIELEGLDHRNVQ